MIPVVLLGLAIVALLLHWRRERRVIHQFALGATRGERNPGRAALALAAVIHRRIPRGKDHAFLGLEFPALLGATPGDVLRRGGCCSGLSRLYVIALRTLGIEAAQVTLYHESGTARHALVEVRIGTDHWIIDPTYGFHYVDQTGRPLGLAALRAGTIPHFRPLGEDGSDGYPRNTYYAFDYVRSKTANWTMTLGRRLSYPPLRLLTRGWIDTLRQPGFLEWPQLVVAAGIAVAALCSSCKVGALVDSAPPMLGDATHLVFVTEPANTTAGAPLSVLKVSAVDSAGGVVAVFNGRVTLALGANPGGDQLHGTVTATAVQGTASFSDVRIDRTGTGYTLRAHIDGLTDATSAAFDISAGAPAAASYTGQPTTTSAGAAITPAVEVRVVDAFGNPVTNYGGTVTVSLAHDGSVLKDASLLGTTTVSATLGVAEFSDLHINQSGVGYTLAVRLPTGSSATVSQPFDIVPL